MEIAGHLREQGLHELGLKAFYLDDGVLAGPQESVAVAVDFVEERLGAIGLSLNRQKCELVPVAGRAHSVVPARFGGFAFRESGDFKLVGAPSAPPIIARRH